MADGVAVRLAVLGTRSGEGSVTISDPATGFEIGTIGRS